MIIDLPNEELVSSLSANRLILTNKRVMYYDNKNYQVIRLAHIRFIEYKVRRFPRILMYTAFVSFAILIAANIAHAGNDDSMLIALIVAVLGILIYLLYTKKIFRIVTSGGSIALNTAGIGKGDIEIFMEHKKEQCK